MKRILLALAILATGATIAISALATTGNDNLHTHLMKMMHHHKSTGGFASHLDEVCDQLDLSDTQRSQIALALEQRLDPAVDAARDLLNAHRTQFEAIHRLPFDEPAVRTASKSVSSAQEELAVQLGAMHASVISVLDETQRSELISMHGKTDLSDTIQAHFDEVSAAAKDWIKANND